MFPQMLRNISRDNDDSFVSHYRRYSFYLRTLIAGWKFDWTAYLGQMVSWVFIDGRGSLMHRRTHPDYVLQERTHPLAARRSWNVINCRYMSLSFSCETFTK